MVRNKLAPNQRIYIGGKMQTHNNMVHDQRQRQVEIMANELFLLESNPTIDDTPNRPMQLDENFVEMLAFVGSQVLNQKTFSTFCTVTHFTRKWVHGYVILVCQIKRAEICVTSLQRSENEVIKREISSHLYSVRSLWKVEVSFGRSRFSEDVFRNSLFYSAFVRTTNIPRNQKITNFQQFLKQIWFL